MNTEPDNEISDQDFLKQLQQIPAPELLPTEHIVHAWCHERGYEFLNFADGLVCEVEEWHAYRVDGNPVLDSFCNWIIDELYCDDCQTGWIELGRVRDLDLALKLIEARGRSMQRTEQ